MEVCEVPELMNIFGNIVCDRQDYCFVCLRTKAEARLVAPDYLKKFVAAVKINTNDNMKHVCIICERQASNAVKVFQAAVFASSLGLILRELKTRRITNKNTIFGKNYFGRLLRKVDLSVHLTPITIDKEVREIRRLTTLTETDTLVMDINQSFEPVAVAMTTRPSENVGDSEVTLLQARSNTPSILPDEQPYIILLDDDDDPIKITTDKEAQMAPNPPPTNTLPTNPLQNTLHTNPAPTVSVSELNPKSLQNLVITLVPDPPKIVPFHEILAKPNINVNFYLHPIFLQNNGDLKVPSLSAVILNNTLYQIGEKNRVTGYIYLNISISTIKHNLRLKNEVFVQYPDNFVFPPCKTGFVMDNHQMKKRKIGSGVLGTSSNCIINSFIISDISSDMDKEKPKESNGQNKTDWEDKIPMDVISFMDAVDPNALSQLNNSFQEPNMGAMLVTEVRSLADEERISNQGNSFIDLS